MEFSLEGLLRVFKRFIWIILAVTVVSAAVFGLYTKFFIGGSYQAEARLYSPTNNIELNIENIKNDAVLTSVSENIKDRYTISTDSLRSMIEIVKVGDNGVFTVKVTSSDSGTAYYVAKSLADVISASTDTFKNISVTNQPSSSPTYSSDLGRNAIVGGVIGLVVSVLGAVIVSLIMKTVYKRKDIENNFSVDVLGAIPKNKNQQALSVLGVYALDTAFSGNCKVVAVAGVGKANYCKCEIIRFIKKVVGLNSDKAETAKDLALAVANKGKKTVYVNARTNEESFGVKGNIGEQTATNVENLSVVNLIDENAQGSIYSENTASLLKALSEKCDCVVVDVESVNASSDALSVHNMVDGYVLNVNAGNDNITQINNAISALSQLGANVHGVVLGNAKESDVFGGRTFEKKNIEQ